MYHSSTTYQFLDSIYEWLRILFIYLRDDVWEGQDCVFIIFIFTVKFIIFKKSTHVKHILDFSLLPFILLRRQCKRIGRIFRDYTFAKSQNIRAVYMRENMNPRLTYDANTPAHK